jgi:membrane-associated phospholipid phosphatase
VLLKFPIRIERPIGSNLEAPLAVIRESSFPSGHVTLYVVLFGFVVYLLWKHAVPALLRGAATILAVVLIVLIGPSRVHLGAHWVGDVVAAYLLGFFFLLVGIEVYERWLLPHGEHRGEKKG